jgi:hypothetical protein
MSGTCFFVAFITNLPSLHDTCNQEPDGTAIDAYETRDRNHVHPQLEDALAQRVVQVVHGRGFAVLEDIDRRLAP